MRKVRARKNSNKMMYGMTTVLILMIAGYVLFASGKISTETNAQIDKANYSMNSSLDKLFLHYEGTAELVAGSRELFYQTTLGMPDPKNSTIARILNDESVISVFCMTPEGKVTAITRQGKFERTLPDRELVKKLISNGQAGRAFFQKGIFSDKSVITFLKPIITVEDIKFEGIAALEVDVQKMWNGISYEKAVPDQYFAAVSSDMKIVVHPDPTKVGTSVAASKIINMAGDKQSGKVLLFGTESVYFRVSEIRGSGLFNMSVVPESSVRFGSMKAIMYRVLYVIGVLIVSYAVTHIVRYFVRFNKNRKENELLKEEIETLKKREESRNDFVLMSVHEIQTIQGALLGVATSILDKGALGKEMRNHLYSIVTSGKRVLSMLGNLACFSEKSFGAKKLRLIPINIRDSVDLVKNMLSSMMAWKNLKMITTLPEDFPEVMADNDSIEQVLVNIIGNAVKFTHQGTIVIEGTCEDGMVEIIVRDNGNAIGTERLDTINAALKSPSMTLDPDLGMGLNISKRIMALHGGSVRLESEQNVGTKAIITLKAAPNASEPVGEQKAEPVSEQQENERESAEQERDEPVAKGAPRE